MQPHDLILKRERHGERIDYVLYLHDGTNVLKRVAGPWTDEAVAKRRAVELWTATGQVYYETAPNRLTAIGEADSDPSAQGPGTRARERPTTREAAIAAMGSGYPAQHKVREK
jgi:hypothetical protein